MATASIVNNGVTLVITYSVTNTMSTTNTYGKSTIKITDISASCNYNFNYARPMFTV